jgi:hypothetical protein
MGHSCHLVWLAHVRKGSASEVSAFEGQVCITPMNGHRQFVFDCPAALD